MIEKERYNSDIEKMIEISDKYEIEKLKEEFKLLLKESNEFKINILFIGSFSAGKSALLNRLIGKNILEESQAPETAIATELYNSEEEYIVLNKKDGNRKIITSELLEDDIVRVITEEEYEQLTLEEIAPIELNSANIDDNATLEGLAHKSYKFNMASWTQPNHNGFTVKISNASSYGGVMYNIIIKRNGNTIYNRACYGAATLTVKAQNNSRYEVIILNVSTSSLKYRVRINSYTRKY